MGPLPPPVSAAAAIPSAQGLAQGLEPWIVYQRLPRPRDVVAWSLGSSALMPAQPDTMRCKFLAAASAAARCVPYARGRAAASVRLVSTQPRLLVPARA